VLHLPNGARIDGDAETVYTAVDDGQAGGDGLYAADIAEATGLPVDQVRSLIGDLVAQDVLAPTVTDEQLGPRYVRGRGL
jgi:DNA-binding IclR family transcriptional regulator